MWKKKIKDFFCATENMGVPCFLSPHYGRSPGLFFFFFFFFHIINFISN